MLKSKGYLFYTSTFLSVIDHILNLLCLCKIKKNVSSFMTYPESLKIGLFVKFWSIFLAVFGHILHFLRRYTKPISILSHFEPFIPLQDTKACFFVYFLPEIGSVVRFCSIYLSAFCTSSHILKTPLER